jgi:hypothetical protein
MVYMNELANTLTTSVQKWTVLDSQMKLINERTKQIREMKHKLTEEICDTMISLNQQDKKIQISDGHLKIYEKKEYSPLTYGYIEETLNDVIKNKEHVAQIIAILKDKREITTTYDIRRNYTK